MRLSIEGVFGEVDSLPGCSQVAVSHAVFVPEELRGKGLGKKANWQRMLHMHDELGYDYALCTVDSQNKAQIALLISNGWTNLAAFNSRKTGHTVLIFGSNLS